jgi:hypothetical protein
MGEYCESGRSVLQFSVLNSLITIGPYMAHRFSWASFKLNNCWNFVCLLSLIPQNVAELFNLNSGIRVGVRGSRAEERVEVGGMVVKT